MCADITFYAFFLFYIAMDVQSGNAFYTSCWIFSAIVGLIEVVLWSKKRYNFSQPVGVRIAAWSAAGLGVVYFILSCIDSLRPAFAEYGSMIAQIASFLAIAGLMIFSFTKSLK